MMESTLPRDNVPFSIEPVQAWRAWRVDLSRAHRGPFLRSVTHKVPWPEKAPFRAHCLTQFRAPRPDAPPLESHDAPFPQHRCGIYALNAEEGIQSWAHGSDHVGGLVKLWGRIFIYEQGYIAEFAYPVALTFRKSDEGVPHEVGQMLAESYGVEIAW